jgi:hypothetical protein
MSEPATAPIIGREIHLGPVRQPSVCTIGTGTAAAPLDGCDGEVHSEAGAR